MKHILEIDDTTRMGKNLINLLREIPSKNTIRFLVEKELEEMEDRRLGEMMEKTRTGEYVDTDKFLKKLRSK